MKILLVEDEPKVSSFIKEGLEENNYEVDVAFDGHIGKNLALKNHYDLLILDIIIPFISGIELCKEIRKEKPGVPVLMLTALGSTDDKIEGFDAGADDYLIKPFNFKELLARIRAITNRTKGVNQNSNTLQVADLILNLDNMSATRGDKEIELSPREFSLLEYLIKNKGRVITRSEIAEYVWDINFDTGTNVIDVFINYLRKKIDRDFPVKLIHTQFGVGFIIKEE